MKKVSLLILLALVVAISFCNYGLAQEAKKETIRITCWEGYADQAVIDAFKSLVKEKYKIDVEVKSTYAVGQEDFYNAAKNGTADLISPPADMAKTPRFNCFAKDKILLSPIKSEELPNLKTPAALLQKGCFSYSRRKTVWRSL